MLHSINKEGRLISVSDAWLSKLGYAREEVIGRRSSEFLTPGIAGICNHGCVARFFSDRSH
ncbi:PAS domain-containing protein [Neorhizobium galegae]|nr:PAS domain-containing protein [Neorhizobium galegae]